MLPVMLELVHRQRELRRRLLHAAYLALLEDPDGFFDADSVTELAPDGAPDPAEPAAADLAARPPTGLERRAAAYYLIERRLVFPMPPEGLLRHGLKRDDLFLHATAAGVDAFEAAVIQAQGRQTARIGFRIGPRSADDARVTSAPAAPPVTAEGATTG